MTREQLNRKEFERLAGRVLAPYARFGRNADTGAYQHIPVATAWAFWSAGQYCQHRPLVDGFGKPIDKGASRRAKSRRPVKTRKPRRKQWQRSRKSKH